MTTLALERSNIALPWGRLSFLHSNVPGRPLILIHPLALSAQMWSLALKPFTGRRIIAVDLRGHGESRWDGTSFSVDDLAIDLDKLLDALHIDKCDIVGMSLGGCVAMTFAAKAQSRVKRLALCDTTAWYGAEARSTWEERAIAADTHARIDLIPFQTDRWFTEKFRKTQQAQVQQIVDIFLRTNGAAHAQACRALGAFDARSLVGSITASTLVVTGEEDYATPESMGRDLAKAIPNAAFNLWPGVRHFAVLESAELCGFIANHVGDGA